MAGPNLELLHWPAAGAPARPVSVDRPPLLFVHGAYSAAWCWDETFLPWFAGKGYEAYAVSLRGHGASDGRSTVSCATLRDYVADVEATIDRLPAPPVLIGHSMGGYVCQQVVRHGRREVAGLALMASTPPHGLYVAAMSMAMRHPLLSQALLLAQVIGPAAVDGKIIGEALFSADMPIAEMLRYLTRFQDESMLVAWESLGFGLANWPGQVDLPVLVMGAADDRFVPRFEVEATAAAFRVAPVIVERMAHAMMLDVRWEAAAKALLFWLDHQMPSPDGVVGGPADEAATASPAD